ncbi:hypothetical protein [Streptomyces acidicola]|uniref:hypothetical protein n=1 Tax=Streptomyces acidicola TaxID=2596892 RepID=UPI001D13B993|nr:hypothetical protein [Streptomyces acidicola]
MVRRLLALPWIHTVYDVALAVLVVYMTSSYDQAFDPVIGGAMALVLLFRRTGR